MAYLGPELPVEMISQLLTKLLKKLVFTSMRVMEYFIFVALWGNTLVTYDKIIIDQVLSEKLMVYLV